MKLPCLDNEKLQLLLIKCVSGPVFLFAMETMRVSVLCVSDWGIIACVSRRNLIVYRHILHKASVTRRRLLLRSTTPSTHSRFTTAEAVVWVRSSGGTVQRAPRKETSTLEVVSNLLQKLN